MARHFNVHLHTVQAWWPGSTLSELDDPNGIPRGALPKGHAPVARPDTMGICTRGRMLVLSHSVRTCTHLRIYQTV